MTTSTEGQVTLVITVEFGVSDTVAPLNWGDLPLLGVDASQMDGLVQQCEVNRTTSFLHSTGAGTTFAERSVSLNATMNALSSASLVLGFQDNATSPIQALAGAAEVRVALSALPGIGDVEVFHSMQEWQEGSDLGAAILWSVRFYPPMHIGAVDPITVKVVASSGRRELSADSGIQLAVVEVSGGSSPADDIVIPDEGSLDPSVVANDTLQVVSVVPFVHVCGNGKRSSAEGCDGKSHSRTGDRAMPCLAILLLA